MTDEDNKDNYRLWLGHVQDAVVYGIIFLIARYLAVNVVLQKPVIWVDGIVFAIFYSVAYFGRKIYDEFK